MTSQGSPSRASCASRGGFAVRCAGMKQECKGRKGRKDPCGWVRWSVTLFFFASLASFAFFVPARAQQQALTPPQDQAAVERGRALLGEQCGFCHGSNARGGSGGPDLTRSDLVLNDDNGRQLGQFLRVGRPDRGMPRFEMSDAQYADLAAFLHAAIYLNSNRRLYKILDIV